MVLSVAESGSFTAAAADLHVAQSSLSRAVLDVERRLGVQLFERTTRRVDPTPAGTELLRAARRLVEEFDTTMAHFQGYLEGTRGAVSIAALPSIAASLLPDVLATYRRSHADVTVSVNDGLSGEVLDLVVSGAVDMALTVAAVAPPEIEVLPVALDEFACVVPADHELAGRASVAWSDLQDRPFVAFDHTSSIRAHTDRVLAERQVVPGPLTEARNIGAVAGLTAAGLGVTAAPGLVLPMMEFAGLVWRPLVDPVVQRQVCLLRHRERPLSRAAADLVALLRAAPGGGALGAALPPLVRWVGGLGLR